MRNKYFKLILFLTFTALIFIFAPLPSHAAKPVDLKEVERQLTTTGVSGWVHGSVDELGEVVFTYRTPGKFFDNIIMSLVTEDEQISAQLKALNRHDQIMITGKFLANPSPQKHILVSSVVMLKKYDSGYDSEPYDYNAEIPKELLGTTSGTFLVHTVAGDGHILVVEYKDAVIPVFVQNTTLTESLFRNDIIELNYKLQPFPETPTHLNLNEDLAEPLRVIESIKNLSNTRAEDYFTEGALIMFPQSPEIKFNVFAVQQDLSGGLKRQFTLVNFDNFDVFTKIRLALQEAWDRHPGEYDNARNKLVSRKIRVRIKSGTISNDVPQQANPQILLNDLSDIEIIEPGP